MRYKVTCGIYAALSTLARRMTPRTTYCICISSGVTIRATPRDALRANIDSGPLPGGGLSPSDALAVRATRICAPAVYPPHARALLVGRTYRV